MNSFLLPQMASVSDLQRDYAALLQKMKESRRPLLVLKKNKLEAVLLDPNLYEQIMEKIRIYEEKQALKAISLYKKEKRGGQLKKMRKVNELFEQP